MKSDSFGSQFLYAEDLLINQQYRTVEVEIEQFIPANTIRSADKRLIDKPTLKFKGKDKMLVLCKTSESVLKFVTGEQPGDSWVGKKITLQVRVVDAFGDEVVAIRVIPPKGTKVRKNVLNRLGRIAEWTGPAAG